MAARRRSLLGGLGALVAILVAVFLLRSGRVAPPAAPGGPDAPGATAASPAGTTPATHPGLGTPAHPAPSAAAGTTPKKEVLAELGWGNGPSELGHHRPQEANPEGPMSMAADTLGNVVVLDQVNGRLLRLDPDGKPVGTFSITQQTPQDIVMAKDGTLLVLDRLKDRNVAILDPDTGALRGELPVQGKGIPEPGLVTGTFVDGKDVYVEREHGSLIRIGDTSGQADTERPEIPGRPTRDGLSYVLAGISDHKSGRVFLNSVDRQTSAHRFTREYHLDFPVMSLTLLDSDLSGTVYLGVAGELPSLSAAAAAQLAIRVYCLAPLDGKVLGQTDLPLNTLPEETFRDFVVLDEGGLLYRHITDKGVSLMRARCH